MDKRNIEATREALLQAAGRLMTACSDPSEVTSRAITKEAGVNLAMINYCFGSREALLFEVFSRLQHEAEQQNPVFRSIVQSEMPPKQTHRRIPPDFFSLPSRRLHHLLYELFGRNGSTR